MTINMEVKKHAMQQLQDGHWKLTLTVHPEDMTVELLQAPMGTPYGLAMVKIDYDNPESVVKKSLTTEKTEGEKLRTRSVMLCKDEGFQEFLSSVYFADKNEDSAINTMRNICHIHSRAELVNNEDAQRLLKDLIEQFSFWLEEGSFKDNLSR